MPNRYHKSKPVREATLETIKLLKETGSPLEEADLAKLEDRPLKSAGSSLRSPGRGPIVPAVDNRDRSLTQRNNEIHTPRQEFIIAKKLEMVSSKSDL